MNKLTFEDVAHMYLGCPIQTAEGIGTFNQLSVGDSNEPIVSFDLESAYFRFSEVKPILIRKEDAGDKQFEELKKRYPHLKGATPGDDTAAEALTFMAMAQVGIDIFGLIDNGEAIDAATLKEVTI